MKVGLFFGSFNPVHVGHLIIANYMIENSDLDKIWMVVTPHNPHKQRATLADDYDRLHLVELATEGHQKIEPSNVEFDLPKPSYTIDTLTHLKEAHPTIDFVLIMGGDNLGTLHKWKNYELILRDYAVYVYQRPSYDLGELKEHPNVEIIEAPQMSISSSLIRKMRKAGQSIRYLVTDRVLQAIEDGGMYL